MADQPAAPVTRESAIKNWTQNFNNDMIDQPAVREIVEAEPKPGDVPPEPKPTPPPAQPAAAKPTEPKSDDTDKWPRTAQDWKKFTKARDEQYAAKDAAIKKLESDLQAERERVAKAIPASESPEFDALRKERDLYSEQLKVVSVENHPKFKAHFENRTNAQIELAKRIVGTEKAERLTTLLKLGDSDYKTSQIENLISDLSPMNQSRIAGVVNALDEIANERQSEISKARENYDKMTAEQQAQANNRKQGIEKMFSDRIALAQDKEKGFFLFQPREGDEAWNKSVTDRIESAKSLLFGSPKPDRLMQAALDAAAYPELLKSMLAADEEIEKLRTQVKELSGASPQITGGRTANGSEAAPSVQHKVGTRPMDAVSNWSKALPND
jgi:hypothetical protein